MLGSHYAAREALLQAGAVSGRDYAAELLAELVTRGKRLEDYFLRCVAAEEGHPDRLEALERLAAAVEVFIHDVKEAEERGKRAALLTAVSFGAVVSVEFDPEDAETISNRQEVPE